MLVNDFGDLPIDADLIESRDDQVIAIAGGCICCSFGSDLMAALMALSARVPKPDHVLIETSGVALPGVVARSVKLLADFALDAVVVVADSESVRQRAADPYMGDTIERQLCDCDLVVLNKTDLVPPAAFVETRTWLETLAPQTRVIRAVRGEVPTEILIGLRASPTHSSQPAPLTGRLRSRSSNDAAARYESACFTPELALDLTRFAQELAQFDLLRAKGILKDHDGSMKTLQLVGKRWEIGAAPAGAPAANRLVCIGLRGSLDRQSIAQAIATATTQTAAEIGSLGRAHP